MKFKKLEISEKVIQRLTEYLSILKDVQKYENEINSIELSKIMNTTSAHFGVRGKGYDISKLIEIIEDILGINKVNNVIIVGHGKMGEMISSNRNVLGKGFQIVGIFDKDKNKIGKVVSDNLEIRDVNGVKEFRENFCVEVDTAILAVVKEQAQFAAEQLVKNGIKAILNMTTYKLELGSDITVVNIDISAKLQELNFWRLNKEEK